MWNWISQPIQQLIIQTVNVWIGGIFQGLANWMTGGFTEVMHDAEQILNSPYITQGIAYTQGIALTLLVVRVGYEALHSYILAINGDPSADPGGLIKRSVKAAALVVCCPWLVKWIFQLTITMATEISSVGGVAQATDISQAMNAAIGAINPVGMNSIGFVTIIMLLCGLVIYLLIFLQMACRAVEIGLIAVAGPLMVLGFVSPSEGLGSVWWRELIVQCIAQPVQILLLRGAMLSLGSFPVTGGFLNILFFIGWMWTTYKGPKIVQQFAMSTGVGGAAGGIAGQAGSIAIMKVLM